MQVLENYFYIEKYKPCIELNIVSAKIDFYVLCL